MKQHSTPKLAESYIQPSLVSLSLGQPRHCHAKYLIIHADDFGMCESVNRATVQALEEGAVSSASAMVPCPQFEGAASYARSHPDKDIGIHLTLTSEWMKYRWGPVAPLSAVRSITTEDGCFWPSTEIVAKQGNALEVERELNSQIERAISAGFSPTHLDAHMLVLYESPELYLIYAGLSQQYKMPFLATANERLRGSCEEIVTVDRLLFAKPATSADAWSAAYLQSIKRLKPGVSAMLVHLGFNDEELSSITGENSAFGSAWRQRDFDLVMSSNFRSELKENCVSVIRWSDLPRIELQSAF